MPLDFAIPWAASHRKSRVLTGKARKSAFITERNASGPALSTSTPAVKVVVISARAHLNSHNPSGTLKECVFGTALVWARHTHRFTRHRQAEAFWPLPPRSPGSRDAEAPWFTDSQVGSTSPAGRPFQG
jgi:hypothetical protein